MKRITVAGNPVTGISKGKPPLNQATVPFVTHRHLLWKVWFSYRQIQPGRGSGGICVPRWSCQCGFGLLTSHDKVVAALVEDRIAGVGADDKVMGCRGVKIDISEANARVGCEAAEVVADDRAQSAATQADGVISTSRDC